MPAHARQIAVHLAAAIICAAAVVLAESVVLVGPDGRPGVIQVRPPELPPTFTTPGRVKATVVHSDAKRLRIDATAPSGVSSTITIVGPPTVMTKGAVETIIEFALALIDKVVTGSGKGGTCTQTVTTTTTGGTSTITFTTKCTSAQ